MGGVKFNLLLVLVLSPLVKGEIIRVASYNFENYLMMDRMVSGKWQRNYPKPEKEKRALRTTINLTQPHILAIQEIGKRPFLNELWQDLNVTNGVKFHHSAWMPSANPQEERHLAILSQIPFKQVRFHSDLEFKYFEGVSSPSRGLLEIEFEINGVSWSMFNLHLKSKWTERDDDPEANLRREKEARVIRDYIRKTYPVGSGHEFLILGDFNDFKHSAPLRRFLSVSDKPITTMIPCVDSRGHAWTHHYEKADTYSRLDYILASPGIYGKLIPESPKIRDEHFSLWASDHRMIYADFDFR